ncbi:MAG: DUF2635 domain-containing protein [Methylocystaceae bacterium]|nr:DUF2635 domain-containing protein [Methylocystaceae bacterium]
MSDKMYIKPAEGMTIPHPDTGAAILESGTWVPNNKFYRGFLTRKEALKSSPPKTTGKAPAKSEEK